MYLYSHVVMAYAVMAYISVTNMPYVISMTNMPTITSVADVPNVISVPNMPCPISATHTAGINYICN